MNANTHGCDALPYDDVSGGRIPSPETSQGYASGWAAWSQKGVRVFQTT